MDDLKVYFYILLLIFYFIFQFLKGSKSSKEKSLPNDEPVNIPPQDYDRPVSRHGQVLEKQREGKPLLKDRNAPEPRVQQHGAPRPRPVQSFEDILNEIDQSMQHRSISEKLSKPAIEKKSLKAETVERKRGKYKSIEPQVKHEALSNAGKEAKPYLHIHQILTSPQGARDAFILSEIFNKKY